MSKFDQIHYNKPKIELTKEQLAEFAPTLHDLDDIVLAQKKIALDKIKREFLDEKEKVDNEAIALYLQYEQGILSKSELEDQIKKIKERLLSLEYKRA